ncbi:alpha/beta hydrolase family protein [Bremerella cremea]|uniref:alpha/beta hydrolase family protein n=1 Tax=Bremerella cremea TaxID=1031537 RepID=UPI0031EA0736
MTFLLRSAAIFVFSLLLTSLALAAEVSWLEDVTTPPADVLQEASNTPPGIESLADWQKEREAIAQRWSEFLGAYHFADLPLEVETLKEERLEHCTRRLIRYQAEPGRRVRAYLLLPHDSGDAKLPAIVALHGTSPQTFDKLVGLAAEPERHMGLRLAEQGFVVICPENYLWEQKSYVASTTAALKPHPGSKGMAVMMADARRAVDLLATLPNVDANRIGAYGHSLGAKEAFYLAAFDDRIVAAVASEGGIEIGFSNWNAIWYLGPDVKQADFALSHHQLVQRIAGRPFLILGGEAGKGCADGKRSWPALISGQKVDQKFYGEPTRIGMLNHGQGHSLSWESGQRVIEWLVAYVKERPQKSP